ncbi:hypothetical protein LTR09_004769 [Extremus antarcticus]|uniref:Dynactin subunit 6 n=1 Tax=Extremus antarcticus TaxID=702011 RepID=A0AAJ0G930_9PEZI|nr:hypothetical protein LTR09_004769 [Extremus antarcticus]
MTTKPDPPSTRQSSTVVPLVKPTCKIHPNATVADKAHLLGSHTISIDSNTIIHPQARLNASHGNISIGAGSIVAEKSVVGLSSEPDDEDSNITIGSDVSIESGAVIQARKVGDNCTLGTNCKVGKGVVLGKWCTVAALCEVGEGEVLEDYTVVFGEGRKGRRVDGVVRERREVREVRRRGMEMEREVLRGIVVDSKMKWMG